MLAVMSCRTGLFVRDVRFDSPGAEKEQPPRRRRTRRLSFAMT
jgi:hypothetical protein